MGWFTRPNNLFIPVPEEEEQGTHNKKYQRLYLYLLKPIKPVSFQDPIFTSVQLHWQYLL